MTTRTAAITAAVVVILAAGCTAAPQDTTPQAATITVHIVDTAGLPVPGVELVVEELGYTRRQHSWATTDATGTGQLTVPVPVNAQVGVRKPDPELQPAPPWRWQTPLHLAGDATVTYRYSAPATWVDCGIVDPNNPDHCP